MQMFIFFLVTSFFVGGLFDERQFLRRPLVVFALCVVVGASYLSMRVLQ